MSGYTVAKPGPGGWGAVWLAHADGTKREQRAQIVGPFAVHRCGAWDDNWRVSHIGTGCSLAGFHTYHDAAKAARELRAACDGDAILTDNPVEANEIISKAGGVRIIRRHNGFATRGHKHPAFYAAQEAK